MTQKAIPMTSQQTVLTGCVTLLLSLKSLKTRNWAENWEIFTPEMDSIRFMWTTIRKSWNLGTMRGRIYTTNNATTYSAKWSLKSTNVSMSRTTLTLWSCFSWCWETLSTVMSHRGKIFNSPETRTSTIMMGSILKRSKIRMMSTMRRMRSLRRRSMKTRKIKRTWIKIRIRMRIKMRSWKRAVVMRISLKSIRTKTSQSKTNPNPSSNPYHNSNPLLWTLTKSWNSNQSAT